VAAFVAQVSRVAPLQIQIGARVRTDIGPDGGPGFQDITAPSRLVELEASSTVAFDSDSVSYIGEASRPVVFRPDSPGYVTDPGLVQYGQDLAVSDILQSGAVGPRLSRAGWLSSFSVAPVTPPVDTSSNNLPIRVRWLFPPRNGFLFTDFLVFYAGSSNSHGWNGRVVWEER
jgi:hypothetical protein